jgi:uncharacterized membrane protein YhaH (DUF805 family)
MKYLQKLCFSFEGRINREVFWLYTMSAAVFHVSLGVLATMADAMIPIAIALFLPLLYADFAVCAKRFHDRGKSGWNALWALVPYVGALYIIIACGFLKGTEGDNIYVPAPPSTRI